MRVWIPGSPHLISGLPEISTYDSQVGYSRLGWRPGM